MRFQQKLKGITFFIHAHAATCRGNQQCSRTYSGGKLSFYDMAKGSTPGPLLLIDPPLLHKARDNYNSLTPDICQVNTTECQVKYMYIVVLMPDHFVFCPTMQMRHYNVHGTCKSVRENWFWRGFMESLGPWLNPPLICQLHLCTCTSCKHFTYNAHLHVLCQTGSLHPCITTTIVLSLKGMFPYRSNQCIYMYVRTL